MSYKWVDYINLLGQQRTPFVFLINFDMDETIIIPIAEVDPAALLFEINGMSNVREKRKIEKPIHFEKHPVNFETYQEAFNIVKQNLQYGNSFLLNLTFQTEVNTNYSLKEVFHISQARYKIWYKDQFVVFSPEIFIQIKNNRIYSYPMKGTIDANIPDAKAVVLADKKEIAEHNTIVDLIRNDLSMVAKKVQVDKFRYIDKISSIDKDLLQVSSQISGELTPDFHKHLGSILFKLLPAGSITGAPKEKTIEIIKEAESYNRGFYTGICGYYDGYNLDTGVMIRFIEKINGKLFYKSGGGITVNSVAENEYNEMIDKVYVPVI